jgi:hypothetical protein
MARATAGGNVQRPVAVFPAQIGDAGAAGFEDAQTEQSEQGDQREVVGVG